MRREKQKPAAHELQDRPVPPVKGAVTDRQDAVLRPEGPMAPTGSLRTEEPIFLETWL